jgi:hypothetical protein
MARQDDEWAGIAGAFAEHARLRPEEPWLFVQRGWDWRWTSFGELAGRVAATVEALRDVGPGRRVGYSGRLSPSLVAADLALQAAALVAVPVAAELSEAARREAARMRGCEAWLELDDGAGAEAPAGLACRVEGLSPSEGQPAAPRCAEPGLPEGSAPSLRRGGVLIARAARSAEVSSGEMESAASALAGSIGPGREREITVLARCLAEPLARLQLAWATLASAAVVLEPDPPAFVATAAWARATVLAGTPEDLALAWERAAVGQGRRSPFGRLHTWLVAEPEAVPESIATPWQHRGVRILGARLPG